MSAQDPFTEEDDLLAGELACGFLDLPEEQAAARRAGSDIGFARRVEWWRDRLVGLFAGSEREPPASAWDRIASRLPANDRLRRLTRAVRIWQGVAALALFGLALAVFLIAGATRDATPGSAVRQQIVLATLRAPGSQAGLMVHLDAAANRLTVTPVVAEEGGSALELWVIPSNGIPRSLGLVTARGPAELQIDPGLAKALRPGAKLAVSREPVGGSPTGQPTGPIVLQGEIGSG